MKKLFIYIFIATCFSTRGIALAEPVTVYAAASLTSALQDLSKTAEKQGISLRMSFASSSILAKQIAQGAPADIYFSANVKWMDFLATQKFIETDTRIDLLCNALVINSPKNEKISVEPHADFDFPSAFDGQLALGDPSHVPAGIYTVEALKKLGWWTLLKNRIAPTMDVRGALTLVARGECAAGIVYATDATISDGVAVIATLPDSLLHTPIVYPIAIVKGRRTPTVEAAMHFFQSDTAATVFQRYGFRVLDSGN
ncbi:MAG: molybdate ABC transporter substrate-binding protein [Gemmatimonadetes bacterium]|nr:molybdate ABC transporter substrate-binding protein [Gemmatimonadota bacterium]